MTNDLYDPMGQAIHDFYYKKPTKKLRVDSAITEDEEIGVDYLFRDFTEMPDIEKTALNQCKGKILDVGAGAGSHSLWLQEKGLSVKAVDVSELSIEVAHKRGVKNAEVADFFPLSENEKYDTILFLMNGVGIAGDLNGLNQLMKKSKQLLRKDGQILLDSSDIIYMFDDDEEYSTTPGEYYGEMQYQMQYGKYVGKPFNWLYINHALLTEYAQRNGLACQLIHKGDHYDYLARITFR